jgi:hypothetical protein
MLFRAIQVVLYRSAGGSREGERWLQVTAEWNLALAVNSGKLRICDFDGKDKLKFLEIEVSRCTRYVEKNTEKFQVGKKKKNLAVFFFFLSFVDH